MTESRSHYAKTRVLTSPPAVSPVDSDVKRPKWSVMIPVYNCGQYLRSTLESVLKQDPGADKMQIEVIDDCSTDQDVEKIVFLISKGRVKYYRQQQNVGSLQNFYTCIDRSRGELIHLLHADDIVDVGFYKTIEHLFEKQPRIGAAFCRYRYINDNGTFLWNQPEEMRWEGILDNWLERMCERQRIQYVAMVVKRDVYEHLGGFYGAEYGEDWEMWTRIAAHYPVGYTPTILAAYRRHDFSISGRSFLTAKNMQDLQWVMGQVKKYLPKEKEKSISEKSRRFYAHYALRVADGLWKTLRRKDAARAQVRAAWGMQKDFFLLCKIMKLYTRMTLNI
jgi:glycosyltransferase involved in cell wall biosynthesis